MYQKEKNLPLWKYSHGKIYLAVLKIFTKKNEILTLPFWKYSQREITLPLYKCLNKKGYAIECLKIVFCTDVQMLTCVCHKRLFIQLFLLPGFCL